jgi:hypothetical protein
MTPPTHPPPRHARSYNDETSREDAVEETGWKLVHGDVFRPPAGFFGPMFLSVFVGSGMQILAMSFFLLAFAVLGFLSPANQGSLLTAFVVLFMTMGSFAGYFSARLYKMFKGKAWKRNTTLTAFAFPGTLFTISLALNFVVLAKKSSLAMPFKTFAFLAFLWLGVSVPLVFIGSYLGFKKDEIKHPVRVNNIPRQIPPQPWYLHPVPSVLVGGILPFGAVFIELFFIMSSIWLAQVRGRARGAIGGGMESACATTGLLVIATTPPLSSHQCHPSRPPPCPATPLCRCTTCLASCSWCCSSWWSRAPRSPSSWRTSSCARVRDGGWRGVGLPGILK